MDEAQGKRLRGILSRLDVEGEGLVALAKANQILKAHSLTWRDITIILPHETHQTQNVHTRHGGTVHTPQDYGMRSSSGINYSNFKEALSDGTFSVNAIITNVRIRSIGSSSHMLIADVVDERMQTVWRNTKCTDNRLIMPLLERQRAGESKPSIRALVSISRQAEKNIMYPT